MAPWALYDQPSHRTTAAICSSQVSLSLAACYCALYFVNDHLHSNTDGPPRFDLGKGQTLRELMQRLIAIPGAFNSIDRHLFRCAPRSGLVQVLSSSFQFSLHFTSPDAPFLALRANDFIIGPIFNSFYAQLHSRISLRIRESSRRQPWGVVSFRGESTFFLFAPALTVILAMDHPKYI